MTTRHAGVALFCLLAAVQLGGQAFRADVASVPGLVDELAARPRKGLGYAPSKALRINTAGELEAVIGSDDQCVKVDGTAGACGTGSGSSVYSAVPAGTVDGANAAFTLAGTPAAGTLRLYRNGVRQKAGLDYTLSGATITFVTEAIPQSGDVLLADYDY